MLITTIESKQNSTIKHLARIAKDKKYRNNINQMVCEGEKMLFEALSSGIKVHTVLIKSGVLVSDELLNKAFNQGAYLFSTDEKLFNLASDVETSQNILFSCDMPHKMADELPESLNGVILLDGIQDPGNLGTILRTADAFALSAVILCEGCTDLFAPKVVRSTMGAIFRQQVFKMPLEQAISCMKSRNLPVYAAALSDNSISINEISLKNTAVIIGNEGRGVTQKALNLCDKQIIIPMLGKAESLNAGVAAAILIWEMSGKNE